MTKPALKNIFPLLDDVEARFANEGLSPEVDSAATAFALKRAAKHLRTHLKSRHSTALSHGEALEAVSSAVGFESWNAASAHILRVLVEEPMAEFERNKPFIPSVSPAKAHRPLPVPEALSLALDLGSETLVVGPEGCGKTVALMLALQHQRAAWTRQKRPVLFLAGPEEGGCFQPWWEDFNRNLCRGGGPSTAGVYAAELDQHASNCDILAVQPQAEVGGLPLPSVFQRCLANSCLSWLRPRAGERPLVVVDGAAETLGDAQADFLAQIPQEASVIWTTTSLGEFGHRTVALTERFDKLCLMKGARLQQAWLPNFLEDLEDQHLFNGYATTLKRGETLQLSARPR